MDNEKRTLKSRLAMVISAKSAKTIKVQIEGIHMHPKFGKYIKRQQSFLVHDPKGECKLGDLVRVEECKPISKLKKWVVREIVQRGDVKTRDSLKEVENDPAGIDA